jgi:minor histocompatibility antigen H13
MVFKSSMMVTVATGLDVPIKLKIPNGDKFSILGLGDIVVPGVLVCWCLKYDVDTYL